MTSIVKEGKAYLPQILRRESIPEKAIVLKHIRWIKWSYNHSYDVGLLAPHFNSIAFSVSFLMPIYLRNCPCNLVFTIVLAYGVGMSAPT